MKTEELQRYLTLSYHEFVSCQTTPTGNRYTVEVVEWPGCSAAGRTRDEAARALEHAKREWLITRSKEGKSIPLPLSTGAAQLRSYEAALSSAKVIALVAAQDSNVKIDEAETTAMTLHELVVAIIEAARDSIIDTKPKPPAVRRASRRQHATV